MPRVGEVRKLLVSQDIGQHRFFSVKRNIFSEIRNEILNDIFAEFDRTNRMKIVTGNRFNLGDLQVDGISTKFTTEFFSMTILGRGDINN